MPTMRTREEVQRAHDLLVAYVTGPSAHDNPATRCIVGALDVLCWVLHHEDQNFEVNLEWLEDVVSETASVSSTVH